MLSTPTASPSANGIVFAVGNPRTEVEAPLQWPYTVYPITSQNQGREFVVARRFSEFKSLHAQLKACEPLRLVIPDDFPVAASLFGRYKPDVIEARRHAFTAYLARVVHALRGARMPPELLEFLGLPGPEASPEGSPAARRRSRASAASPEGVGRLPSVSVPAELEPADVVILVSYQLPLLVSRAEGGGWSVGWDPDSFHNLQALNLALPGTRPRTCPGCVWVGCVPIDEYLTDVAEQEELAELLLAEYSCVAVFLDAQLHEDFYHGFCRGYLRRAAPPRRAVRRCARA